MLDLLLLPFRLCWGLLCMAFKIVGGIFSLIFGLAGGLLSLVIHGAVAGAIIGVIAMLIGRRRQASQPKEEEFISFYDKDAVK